LQRYISAAPSAFTSHVAPEQPIDSTTSYNIFSSFLDLPFETPDLTLQAFPAVDSKVDTLSQSQMLHDNDKAKFVTAQIPEIRGLQDLDVFKKQKMSQKPKGARLLSSIWSYKRKRSPIGTILKYKSRLCVDGSQQELD
jgi:hypothetical protein